MSARPRRGARLPNFCAAAHMIRRLGPQPWPRKGWLGNIRPSLTGCRCPLETGTVGAVGGSVEERSDSYQSVHGHEHDAF